VGKPEGIHHLEDQGVDGRIILKWILNNMRGHLAQGMDKWRLL
jgi:hypothetical protein